jgi:23S rRNA pseudouridine1911/1915/1917 synthase
VPDCMTVRLSSEAFGQRLDRALVAALAARGRAITRSNLQRAFAAGDVREQGRRLKPGRVVDRELDVELRLPEPEPLHARPEDLPLTVVHEDDAVLVVEKAAGVVVHAGAGHASGTLVNAVLHHLQASGEARSLPTMPGNPPSRPGIVHRLDKDTSGLLVIAKTERAQECLAAQFRTHAIERAYLGIVAGNPPWSSRRIETGHGRDPADRRRFSPEAPARRAVTNASVVRQLRGAALLRFVLETGRTHQIRMHARHVGHPILGDALYGGGTQLDPALRERVAALGRHALHAAVLGFEHPDGRRLRFESSLPSELEALVQALLR